MSTSAQADQINAAATDPAPEMPTPLDDSVELLRGVHQELDGQEFWHDVARVRELNGADEEALDILGKKKGVTYTQYMDALLKRAVLNIGTIDVQQHPEVLDKLILADRNTLFLAIVKATYGNTRTIRATCNECSTSNDIEIELDEDFKIRKPSFSLQKPIIVDTHKGSFSLRLPNGEDLIEAQKDGNGEAETNSIILSRCLIFGEKAPADKLDYARQLNAGVRRKLIDTLLDVEAGPDLEGVDTQCANCGAEMPVLLDWVSLLLG